MRPPRYLSSTCGSAGDVLGTVVLLVLISGLIYYFGMLWWLPLLGLGVAGFGLFVAGWCLVLLCQFVGRVLFSDDAKPVARVPAPPSATVQPELALPVAAVPLAPPKPVRSTSAERLAEYE